MDFECYYRFFYVEPDVVDYTAVSLKIAGVNHCSSPLDIRERLASRGVEAAAQALSSRGWKETVVLSTCNRFEIYAAGGRESPLESSDALADIIGDLAGVPVSRFSYRHEGENAVRHLFEVASGLDSLVLGETEVLGQVKKAYEFARKAGTTGKRTNVLFQKGIAVGKAVRSRTNISMGQVSVASVAVELAKRIFGQLTGSTILILGAGEMAEKTARYLKSAKVSKLYFANRTWEKGVALAENFRAEAVRWESIDRVLDVVDIVVASTGAPDVVVTRERVEAALARRGGRSLFFIDIAMPRDVSPDVHSLDGVYLYSMDDLKSIVAENLSRRETEIVSANKIIHAEAKKMDAWLASLDSGREIRLRHSPLSGRRESRDESVLRRLPAS